MAFAPPVFLVIHEYDDYDSWPGVMAVCASREAAATAIDRLMTTLTSGAGNGVSGRGIPAYSRDEFTVDEWPVTTDGLIPVPQEAPGIPEAEIPGRIEYWRTQGRM